MKIKLRAMWIIQFIFFVMALMWIVYVFMLSNSGYSISKGYLVSKSYSFTKISSFFNNIYLNPWIWWMVSITILSLVITSFTLGVIILSSKKPLNAKGTCITTGILAILVAVLAWIPLVGIGLNLTTLIVSLIAAHKVKL